MTVYKSLPRNHQVQVFEMGFRSPFAGHYRYLATALKLKLILLPLEPDARGIASQEVKLSDLQDALRQLVKAMGTVQQEL